MARNGQKRARNGQKQLEEHQNVTRTYYKWLKQKLEIATTPLELDQNSLKIASTSLEFARNHLKLTTTNKQTWLESITGVQQCNRRRNDTIDEVDTDKFLIYSQNPLEFTKSSQYFTRVCQKSFKTRKY